MVQTNFNASDGPSLAAVLLDISSGADAATNTAYSISLTQALSTASETVSLQSGSSVTLQGAFPFIVNAFTVTGTLIADLNYTGTVTLNNGILNNSSLTTNSQGTIVAGLYTGAVLGTTSDSGDAVTNNGTITSNSGFAAVSLNLGTIQNGWNGPATALITGSAGGVFLQTAGLVQNGGSIIGGGVNTSGVYMAAGTIDNGQIGDIGARIAGGVNGVQITGAGVLFNDGTVAGGSADAVYLGSGTVTNGQFGDLTALISGGPADNGVWIGTGTGTVNNLGTITGGAASGVLLAAGGTVSNGATSDTAAQITGAAEGVLIALAGALLNDGTVLANGSDAVQSVIGAFLEHGGSIGNLTAASLIKGLEWGAIIEGAAGTVTNLGLIQASATSGLGVELTAAGNIVNGASAGSPATISGQYDGVRISAGTAGSGASVQNEGTISGTVGVDFASGAVPAAGTVINDGLIKSTTGTSGFAVVFGTGAETLLLRPAGAFVGHVLGNNAVGNSTTLELAAGTLGTLTALGSDAGTVTDAAGSFGFNAIGTIAVDAGALWTVVAPGTMDTVVNAGGLNVVGGPVTISGSAANSGQLSIAGATLTAATGVLTDTGVISVGAGGVLNALGGGIAAAGTPAIQVDGGSIAALDVSGAGATANSSFRITIGSTTQGSALINHGGTVTATTPFTGDEAIVIGGSTGATGALTISDPGSKLQVTGQLSVGLGGAGSLVIQNQATVSTGNDAADAAQGFEVGQGGGSSGQATVTGANSLLTNAGRFIVGDAGLGSLSVNGAGAVQTTLGAVVANSSSASGSAVNVSGASSSLSVAGTLLVGNAGFGSLSISQGATVTAAGIDEAAAATGGGVISVTGTGSALTLTGSLTVGDQSAGEVSILGGATVNALSVTIGNASAASSGNVDVEGTGSSLLVGAGGVLNVGVAGGGSGVLTIGAGTTLHSAAGIVVTGHASFNNNGGVVDPPFVDFTGPSNAGLGSNSYDLYVENIGAVQLIGGTGVWTTPMMLTGTSVADANNNINVNGDAGAWQLSSGGTLIVNANTVDSGQAVVFEDSTDTLVIGQIVNNGSAGVSGTAPVVSPGAENLMQAGGWAATIWGYVAGDKIQFANMTVSSASVVNGNTVDLFGPGNVSLGSLAFFNKAGSKASPAGATAAAAQIPCFAAGTRIATADGWARVEDLAVGDTVLNHHDEARKIVWIGQRTVNCAAHPQPETVWPVRVSAGAFGVNVPARDLCLSPDHAVFVNDVLVPVKLLVNGTSVVQTERRSVTYHHLELERHDIILAEGLTVESYLDTGDRSDFRDCGATIQLHPDFAPDTGSLWETRGAAPLVTNGPLLEAARRTSWTAR